jgi:hypothetical protein
MQNIERNSTIHSRESPSQPDFSGIITLVDRDEDIITIKDAESAKRAITTSLQTRRLREMWFAGEQEMLLYARATKGAVRFVVFSSADHAGSAWAMPRVKIWQMDGSSPTREIVLHLCSVKGAEGSGVPNPRTPAHYNVLFPRSVSDDTRSAPVHWLVDPEETVEAQARRHAILWEQCKAAILENAREWEAANNENGSLRLALSLEGEQTKISAICRDPLSCHSTRPVA